MPNYWSSEELLAQIAQESGLVGSGYHAGTVLPRALRRALEQVWVRLTEDSVGYGRSLTLLLASPGVDGYVALPLDHAQTRLLERTIGADQYFSCHRTTEARWRSQYHGVNQPSRPGEYWYTQEGIVLRPVPTEEEVLQLTYITTPPPLLESSSKIDLPHGIADVLITLAAAIALSGTDNSLSSAKKSEAEQKLTTIVSRLAGIRDRSPDYVTNYQDNGDIIW